MLKNHKWKLIMSSLIILLPVLVGLCFWNALPDSMTTHWGVDGNADGWSTKPFAVFGLPALILAVHWLCVLVTARDPKNKEQSGKVFGMVLWLCPLLSLFVGFVVYADAFGMRFDIEVVTLFLIGLMFAGLGNYLPKCKQNYTIGIKVKWALENEANWNATHRLGGRLWVVGGVLMMLCVFLPGAVIPWVLIVLLTAMAIIPIVYSYIYYKKQQRS